MDTTKNKICALIPFFNEEKFIFETVTKTLRYVDCIIAVNDGSTDNSEKLISNFQNVFVFKHEQNFGKGKAIKTGFLKAMEMECELLITLDADMQHDPELIPKFIAKYNSGNFDLIIGNRLHDISSMPIHRRASNFLTSFLISLKTGVKIKDSQSGFRLFDVKHLQALLPKFSGFEAESEILIKAARNNLKIGFVNIPTIYNSNESKMKSLDAIIGFIKVLFI